MINLDTSTMPELKAEFVRLAAVVSVSESDRKAIWSEIGRRKDAAAARAAIKNLDPEQRAALKEALS